MTDIEILKKVKLSRGIQDDGSDDVLLQKIQEAKAELLAQGISQNQINNNPLAISAITLWIGMFWGSTPDLKHSEAYLYQVSRLYSLSLQEVTNTLFITADDEIFLTLDDEIFTVEA